MDYKYDMGASDVDRETWVSLVRTKTEEGGGGGSEKLNEWEGRPGVKADELLAGYLQVDLEAKKKLKKSKSKNDNSSEDKFNRVRSELCVGTGSSVEMPKHYSGSFVRLNGGGKKKNDQITYDFSDGLVFEVEQAEIASISTTITTTTKSTPNTQITYLQSSYATTCHIVAFYTPIDRFGSSPLATLTHVATKEDAEKFVTAGMQWHNEFISKRKKERFKRRNGGEGAADHSDLYDAENDIIQISIIGGTTDRSDRHSTPVSSGVFDAIARVAVKRSVNQNIFVINNVTLQENDVDLDFLGEKRKGGCLSGLRISLANGEVSMRASEQQAKRAASEASSKRSEQQAKRASQRGGERRGEERRGEERRGEIPPC